MSALLKLKLGVEFRYEDGNYIFERKYAKRKKITSRLYPDLLGKNQYTSIGHSILERFSLLEKEEIDPFYSVRGELAERLALRYIKDLYKKIYNMNIECRTWDKDEVKYDNFRHLQNYGGLIDIAITSPEEHIAVVEVKSKNMDKFKSIERSQGNIEEVMQGEYLAYLSAVDKYIMIYAFFSNDQEKMIHAFISKDCASGYEIEEKIIATKLLQQYDWLYKSIKFQYFTNTVDKAKMKTELEECKQKLDAFEESGVISETLFDKEERMYLDKLIGRCEGEVPIIKRIF